MDRDRAALPLGDSPNRSALPAFFGVLLIVFGLVAVVFQPVSGTWALIILGVFVIYAARKNKAITESST